jgi:hypothetical protein
MAVRRMSLSARAITACCALREPSPISILFGTAQKVTHLSTYAGPVRILGSSRNLLSTYEPESPSDT